MSEQLIYMVGGGLIILGLISKIAWITAPKLAVVALVSEDIKEATSYGQPGETYRHIRLMLRNISWADIHGLKAEITKADPPLSGISQTVSMPVILTTQQRLRHAIATKTHVPQKRFDLARYEEKQIHLFHAKPRAMEIVLPHESGEYRVRLFEDYMLTLCVNGGGVNEVVSVKVLCPKDGGDSWGVFLIRDEADLQAYEELGWRDEAGKVKA